MTTIESQQTRISKNPDEIFDFFSDLNNIGKLTEKVPASKADKLKNLEYSADSFAVSMSPIGKIVFRVIDRSPFEYIRFITENTPFELHIQLNFEKQQEKETDFKIVAEANLNPFLKPMVAKPLQEAVDKMADSFAFIFNQV